MYKQFSFVLSASLFIYFYVLLYVLFISLSSIYFFINLRTTLTVLSKNQQYFSEILECNLFVSKHGNWGSHLNRLQLWKFLAGNFCMSLYLHRKPLFLEDQMSVFTCPVLGIDCTCGASVSDFSTYLKVPDNLFTPCYPRCSCLSFVQS